MIWITGSKGMLGRELVALCDKQHLQYTGTDTDLDITDTAAVDQFVAGKRPEWIVNCAAYTAVDKAEEELAAAYSINETGASNIALAAKKYGARLIHISTDYVFGTVNHSRPLVEHDKTSPESVYGTSKCKGEEAIRNSLEEHFIIRTAWLYGAGGSNFVLTMLKLFSERPVVTVVDDQLGCPTWTRDLAGFILRIISMNSRDFGTYHYCGNGQTSWFGFAKEIYRLADEAGLLHATPEIKPCTSDEFPRPAKRPRWSVLSKEKIRTVFNADVPQWNDSLRNFINEIKENQG